MPRVEGAWYPTWGRWHPGRAGAAEHGEVFLRCGAQQAPQGPWEPWRFLGGTSGQGRCLCVSIDNDSHWPLSLAGWGWGGLLSPKGPNLVRGWRWGRRGALLLRGQLLLLAHLGERRDGARGQQGRPRPNKGHTPQLLLLRRAQPTLPPALTPLPSLPGSRAPGAGLGPLFAVVPGREQAGRSAGLGGRGHQGGEVLLLEGTAAPGGHRVHQCKPHGRGHHRCGRAGETGEVLILELHRGWHEGTERRE